MDRENPYATPVDPGAKPEYDWSLFRRVVHGTLALLLAIALLSSVLLWQRFEDSSRFRRMKSEDPNWQINSVIEFFVGR